MQCLGYDSVSAQHKDDATRTLVLVKFPTLTSVLMNVETFTADDACYLIANLPYNAFAGFKEAILPSQVALPNIILVCVDRCIIDDERFSCFAVHLYHHHIIGVENGYQLQLEDTVCSPTNFDCNTLIDY